MMKIVNLPWSMGKPVVLVSHPEINSISKHNTHSAHFTFNLGLFPKNTKVKCTKLL